MTLTQYVFIELVTAFNEFLSIAPFLFCNAVPKAAITLLSGWYWQAQRTRWGGVPKRIRDCLTLRVVPTGCSRDTPQTAATQLCGWRCQVSQLTDPYH